MLDKLIEHAGIPGIILALCLLAIYKQYLDSKKDHKAFATSLQEAHTKRVEDAHAMVERLLKLNDKWNETLSAHLRVGAESTKVLEELRDQVKELSDDLKD